jgi:phosphoribosyl-AMP cyclohydrolase
MTLFDTLKFDEKGLVPAIIQNAEDGRVLTLCYMSREAVEKTLATGKVHVFRRSMGRVMLKGEVSGHVQDVTDLFLDCEGNSLLVRVKQQIAACHTGYFSCYYRRYDPNADRFTVVEKPVFDPAQAY